MRLRHPRASRQARLMALALLTTFGPAVAPARAQWGLGWGGGIFYNPNALAIQTQAEINSRSNLQASAAYASRSSISPGNLGNNPSYFYHSMRDDSFFQRYDPATRRMLEDRVAAPRPDLKPVPGSTFQRPGAPAPRTTTVATATPAPAPTAPVLPLASFFNKYQELIWPAEAPNEGDLKAERDRSDAASLVVLKETEARKVASMASVTDARNKLLAYGRPALKIVRQTTTSRVADGFHLFLLSLYESLAQAAIPPQP